MKLRKIKGLLLGLSVALLAACSANYEVGDLSKAYCDSTSPEVRAAIKGDLEENNITLGVDFCSAVGLIDAIGVFNKAMIVDHQEDIERQVNSNKLAYKESNVFIATFAKVQNNNFERMQQAS